MGIKAYLLEDKQISSVRVFDEVKSVTLLEGHLSLIRIYLIKYCLKSFLLSFLVLWRGISQKKLFWTFLEHKSEENDKVSKTKLGTVPDCHTPKIGSSGSIHIAGVQLN